MHNKKHFLCEKIIQIKTSILVIEAEKQIATKLRECLQSRHIDASIKSKNIGSRCKIKPFDIYIVDAETYAQNEKYEIIQKILKQNNQANIFLLNDNPEEKTHINTQYGGYAHILKSGQAVNEVIRCDELGLETIIKTIEDVENTKKKIHDLWVKLEKA